MLNKTTTPPRRSCSKELLTQMRELGVKTSGSDTDMENILKRNNFGLPSKEDEYFGFTLNGKYQYRFFCRADALAELIILLKKLKLL